MGLIWAGEGLLVLRDPLNLTSSSTTLHFPPPWSVPLYPSPPCPPLSAPSHFSLDAVPHQGPPSLSAPQKGRAQAGQLAVQLRAVSEAGSLVQATQHSEATGLQDQGGSQAPGTARAGWQHTWLLLALGDSLPLPLTLCVGYS